VHADTSSFGSRILILLGVTAMAATVVFPIAMVSAGVAGVAAAATAMAICLGSGLLVFWLARYLSSPEAVMYQVLLGMMTRMGISLAACMVIYVRGGWLADAGLVYFLLVFYFVTLAAETALLVSGSAKEPPKAQAG
jgi:hypothetical protein